MSLLFDIITLVIEQVDDAPTLFSLLTVNKAAFAVASRVLYRAPLSFKLTSDKLHALIRRILILSPADDEATRRLRKGADIAPQTWQDPARGPMADYLSFVRVVCWEVHNDPKPFPCLAWRVPKLPGESGLMSSFNPATNSHEPTEHAEQMDSFIKKTLTWAMCGHNLANMEQLMIECEAIDDYIAAVKDLSGISKIVVCPPPRHPGDRGVYDKAVSLVEAIQKHHGKEQLRECHVTMNPLQEGPLTDEGTLKLDGPRRLYSLLPKSRSPPTLLFSCGEAVVLDRMFDKDLQRLTTLKVKDDGYQWKTLRTIYPDLSPQQILQRCRNLEWIDARILLTEADLFVLARDEAEQHLEWQQQQQWPTTVAVNGGGSATGARPFALPRLPQPSRMPPVKTLTLDIDGHDDSLHENNILRAFEDALVAYAGTVSRICVRVGGFKAVTLQGPPMEMPLSLASLTSIIIHANQVLSIDASFWKKCPVLEDLRLFILKDTIRTASINDLFRGSVSHWPVVESPSLKSLHLDGNAFDLFDPASFAHLPNLRDLTLKNVPSPSSLSVGANATGKTRDASVPTDPSPTTPSGSSGSWTWDWPLQSLCELHILQTDPKNLGPGFDVMRILRSFRFLRKLLTLTGSWDISTDKMGYLLGCMQGLVYLTISSTDASDRISSSNGGFTPYSPYSPFAPSRHNSNQFDPFSTPSYPQYYQSYSGKELSPSLKDLVTLTRCHPCLVRVAYNGSKSVKLSEAGLAANTQGMMDEYLPAPTPLPLYSLNGFPCHATEGGYRGGGRTMHPHLVGARPPFFGHSVLIPANPPPSYTYHNEE
ncbi:hypothetical protein BGX23_010164 [Mortierella sp. AD031]|nr:hypothetical protein BGX23_010164 [Mortierella sp. AD031]